MKYEAGLMDGRRDEGVDVNTHAVKVGQWAGL